MWVVKLFTVITHRRSIDNVDGRCLSVASVCLFVDTITSKWLNVGCWNFAVRCIVQKSLPSSNLWGIAPTWVPAPQMWWFAESLCKNQQTDVGMACVAVGHATTFVSKYVMLVRQFYAAGKNQHMLSSFCCSFITAFVEFCFCFWHRY